MKISDLLIPALRERFADRGMRSGSSDTEIAVFPAAHPEVGDLAIWDEEDEVTLGIGTITHGHFNPYDESLSSEAVAKSVTDEVLEFLEALFADRVVLSKSRDGRSGGWRMLENNEELSLQTYETTLLTYLWSGPIETSDINHEPHNH